MAKWIKNIRRNVDCSFCQLSVDQTLEIDLLSGIGGFEGASQQSGLGPQPAGAPQPHASGSKEEYATECACD